MGPSRARSPVRAQGVSDEVILQAEQFKAQVAVPKGKEFVNQPNPVLGQSLLLPEIELLRQNDNDDDFFHITCHIDPVLKAKIEPSEFVELEKLLAKEGKYLTDESRVELVSRGGSMYFAPVQDNAKISSIRKWEQAFRIYAAIYTRANPERALEIWQYVYCINTAAQSYHWDNVAFYDTTFRQLMAFKPWHSWAKTYMQGWNLAMRDPIAKSVSNAYNLDLNTSGNKRRSRDWRDDCCWRYNKNRCRDLGCKFDHRCTYCGGWGHGYFNCRKRLRKVSSSSESRSPRRSRSPTRENSNNNNIGSGGGKSTKKS